MKILDIIAENRNPDLMSPGDYERHQQSQMDYEKRDFKRREMEHELDHEERGYYQVMIAKNGKWEYAKVQPKREGMNPAMDIIRRLHEKYPSMHLGMMWPDGHVENYGKGRKLEGIAETASAGTTSSDNVNVGAVYKNKPAKAAKNKDGTVKNALDMDSNLLTGGSIGKQSFIKR